MGRVSERGVIFSAPMVQALLDGRKTQTRRLASSPLAKVAAGDLLYVREACRAVEIDPGGQDAIQYRATPTFEPSPIWNSREAAEAWGDLSMYGKSKRGFTVEIETARRVFCGPWVPSIHMPRWASRLDLTVESVRFQRLQDISAADAEAEGVFRHVAVHSLDKVFRSERGPTAIKYYQNLWTKLHGADSWRSNPEVVVIEFSVEEGAIGRPFYLEQRARD